MGDISCRDYVLLSRGFLIFDFYGIPLLDGRPYPVNTIGYLVAKRAFDVVFSIVALVVTAPLLAIAALFLKLTFPGPVFFIQERSSLNGTCFGMVKSGLWFCRKGTRVIAAIRLETILGSPRWDSFCG